MMRRFLYIWLAFLVFAAITVAGTSRKKTDNEKSPSATTSTKLGGHEITIDYNAPSARGRKVEGGLVPYGKVWRLGADNATTMNTEADIQLGKLRLPKGEYTLWIAASESGWQLVVNKQTGQWGTNYSPAQDFGRTPMTLKKLGSPVEKLDIELKSSGGNAGTLTVRWGNTEASVPVKLA